MTLTYDMTFLILLLSSLYEPEEHMGSSRCLPHPVHPRPWSESAITDYAADMNVALAYYNCLDDWQDDRDPVKLAAAKALEGAYRKIRSDWPRQCQAIEQELTALSQLEKAGSSDLDAACQSFGRLMAQLFILYDDRWAPELTLMANRLGQFIYLMDAHLDREEDEKKGHYNPILTFEAKHGPFDPMGTLTMLIGECTLAFERLPLEQDMNLLRNILYSGVWVRYAMQLQKKQKKLSNQQADSPPASKSDP